MFAFWRRRKRNGKMRLKDLVALYREFGFFHEVDSPIALGQLEQDYSQTYLETPTFPSPDHDLFLLALDKPSVWADDPEADVCAENCVYEKVLLEWSAISHGSFQPADIVEEWESDEGPITVSFTLNGRPATIRPQYRNDWIDLGALSQINALIRETGRCFDYIVDGNNAVVVTLRTEDRPRLLDRRNLRLGLGR